MFTPFFLEETILLALLAGLLAVDERAGWQSLLSEPVFAALLVGLVIGPVRAALLAGVAMQLVWLSILPMRGTRRPDPVVGGVVGTGTACLLLRHTGDPREAFVVAVGVLAGLVVAEVAGAAARVLNRFREARLAGFDLPDTGGVGPTAARLVWYQLFSVTWHALVAMALAFVALPLCVVLCDRITGGAAASFVRGSEWWLTLIPAVGAAALIQNFWHRDLNRFLVLSAGVVLLILWIR